MNTKPQMDTNDWPARRSMYGVTEIAAQWVAENVDNVRLVDIREPFELVGPLGAIEGATNVPMRALLDAAQTWDANERIVLVCRSASRTSHATRYLEQMGFTRIASMAGGMINWNRLGLPTV